MKLTFVLVCLAATIALGQQQPLGWRGAGSGVYPGPTPPTHWSFDKSGEAVNVRWRTKLPGPGHSQPVAVGGRVLVTCDPGWLVCLDADSGQVLWKDLLRPKAGGDHFTQQASSWEGHIGYAFATPVTDGRDVFVSYVQGQVARYDLQGARKWVAHISLQKAQEATKVIPISRNRRPITQTFCNGVPSPILADDVLIVQSIGGIRAFDRSSGKLRWEVLPYLWYYQCGTGFVAHIGPRQTPVLVTDGGWAVRVADGKVLSRNIGARGCGSESGGASVIGHADCVYILSGNNSGHTLHKIRLGLNGDELTSETLWEVPCRAASASPIYHDGRIYTGVLEVFDAGTGRYLGQPDDRSLRGSGGRGSPVLAGEAIYLPTTKGDTIGVFSAAPSPRLLARGPAKTDRRRTHSTPGANAGRLYYRDPGSIVCIASDLADDVGPAPQELAAVAKATAEGLTRHLASSHPRVRLAAVTRLAEVDVTGDAQADALWELLKGDPYPEIRAAATETLIACVDTDQLMATCWRDLTDRDRDKHGPARRVVQALGEKAVSFLVEKLASTERGESAAAMDLLAAIGPSAGKALPALRKHQAPTVVVCAVQPDSARRVAEALKGLQANGADRRRAEALLQVIRAVPGTSAETVDALLAIEAGRETILPELVRMRAHVPRVVAALCGMYGSDDPEVRALALRCLRDLRGQAAGAGPTVASAIRDADAGNRKAALSIIGALPHDDALAARDVLIECMKNPPEGMKRRDAAQVLLRFGREAKPALPFLLKAAERPPEGLHIWLIWDLLSAIGPDAAAAAPAIRAHEPHSSADRQRAAQALKAIGASN